jgi:hypothetical protein
MTGAKKHITALAMLLLVSAPMLVPVGYLLQKHYVRHKMEERLEKAALQTLFVAGEPHWAKPGKEIWLNNQLFDVKEIRPAQNGYIVKGLFDTQETAIAKKAAGQSERQTNGTLMALRWLLTALYQPAESPAPLPMPALVPVPPYIPYQSPTATLTLGVATPPPDRA